MAEFRLTAQNALPQGEALTLGGTVIRVLPMRRMTSLAPFGGAEPGGADLAGALQSLHGVTLPGPGQSVTAEDVECLWFGYAHVLLIGPEPHPDLARVAAMTEQGDAWCSVLISGPLARDVLARLCPLDLRDSAFPPGATARSEVGGMMVSLTRVEAEGFRVMAFRSMAQTLLQELRSALTRQAARGRPSRA